MKLVARSCPVCGPQAEVELAHEANYDIEKLDSFAFASRKIPENMHFRLNKCCQCSIMFANPAPAESDLIGQYNEAAFDSSTEANLAARTYAKLLRKFLALAPARDAALDIGTGNGAFILELLALGFKRPYGIEPSKAPIAAADNLARGLIQHGAFEASLFEANSFDLVSCFQTLEHVYTPGKMLGEIMTILKPGGAVFFVDHDYTGILNRIMGLKSPIYDIEHMQLFNRKSMRRMLENAGYENVRMVAVWNAYPLKYWVRLGPIPKGLKGLILDGIDKVGLGNVRVALPVGNFAAFATKPSGVANGAGAIKD